MGKESTAVRFLYNTAFGRVILKLLVNKRFSDIAGAFLKSSISKPMIKMYIRRNKIDMKDYEERDYKSFNDFFTRKKKHISADEKPSSVISPCDGYLSVYEIDEHSLFEIKNATYDLRELLKDEALADRYKGGTCFIFRLTPRHFHRYCFAGSGKVTVEKKIPGVLHCVRPIACCRYPVYVQNQRTYTEIETENMGRIIQMEIGAIMVGRIYNHPVCGNVLRGQEKGFFEFGGSTIVLLTEKDKAVADKQMIYDSEQGIETEVKVGEKIAEAINCEEIGGN